MSDYLNRIIQRSSGRLPVIKPLVRSRYGASMQFKESTVESEEASVHGGISDLTTRRSALPTPRAGSRQIDIPPTDNAKRDLVETDKNPEIIPSAEDVERSAGSVRKTSEGNLAKGGRTSSTKRENPRGEAKAKSSENSGKGNDVLKGDRAQRESQPDTRPGLGTRGLLWTDERFDRHGPLVPGERLRPLVRNDPSTPEEDERLIAENHGVGSAENVPVSESNVDPRHAEEVRGMARGASREFESRERELVREEDMIRKANLVRHYEPQAKVAQNEPATHVTVEEGRRGELSSDASTNIRVTIERVEIKGVQETARQIQQTSVGPKGPAVTLDDYLKRRNEEKR